MIDGTLAPGLARGSADARTQRGTPPLPPPPPPTVTVAPCLGPGQRFARSLAVVLGVDAYSRGIPTLRSAVSDARAVAAMFRDSHQFEVIEAYDADVSSSSVKRLFVDELPSAIGRDDRLLVYFAGHGVAVDNDDGPAGHLLLYDARRDDESTFLAMRELHDAITALPCRHCLIVLDCCFAGSFHWSGLRDVECPPGRPLYREAYDRFVESPAWQVLTSAASDQPALDRLSSDRGEDGSSHSPFAMAMLEALAGGADYSRDGVITAQELAIFLRDHVELSVGAAGRHQTPQLFPLRKHRHGEFVFQDPGCELNLPPAPELTADRNPYRGLGSFDERDAGMFFGRTAAIETLVDAIRRQPLTVVAGPSGAGKSSLVKAGVVPVLRATGARIGSPVRPGQNPSAALRGLGDQLAAIASGAAWSSSWPIEASAADAVDPSRSWLDAVQQLAATDGLIVVVVDQLEELITQRVPAADSTAFLEALAEGLRRTPSLRIVVTIRSDIEPTLSSGPLKDWWLVGRRVVPVMTRAELREAIEGPAARLAMYFEPASLVDRLIDEVMLLPAPLPLLSFALSEIYGAYWSRHRSGGVRAGRAMTETDYEMVGTVASALTRRATTIFEELAADPPTSNTARNVMLRMVTLAAGEVARRRVPRDELVYADDAENRRVETVIERFHDARLLAVGTESSGPDAEARYVEPVHDELVRGWTQMKDWLLESPGTRVLLRALGTAASAWESHGRGRGYLWYGDPRLPQARSLMRSGAVLLNARETLFVRESRRRRVVRRVALWTTVAAVIASLVVAIVVTQRSLVEARDQRANAIQRQVRADGLRKASDQLVEFMLVELKPKLARLGRLDVMKGVGDRVADHYEFIAQAGEVLDVEASSRRAIALNTLGDVLSMGGDVNGARASYERALEHQRQVAADDAAAVHSVARILENLSAVRMRQGDVAAAVELAEAARDSLEALAPAGIQAALLVRVYRRLGVLAAASGRQQAAADLLERGIDLGPESAAAGASREARLEVAASLDRLSDVRVALGELPAARDAASRGLSIRTQLAAVDPGDLEVQEGIAISWSKLYAVEVRDKDLRAARLAAESAIAVLEPVALRDPGNDTWAGLLEQAYARLADLAYTEDRYPDAVAVLFKVVAIADRLAMRDPANLERRDELATQLGKLGNNLTWSERTDQALPVHLRALTLWNSLVARDADNPEYRLGLASADLYIGNVHEVRKDQATAAEWYRRRLVLFEQDLVADERNPVARLRVADAQFVLGTALARVPSRRDEGLALMVTGLGALVELRSERLLSVEMESSIPDYEKELALARTER